MIKIENLTKEFRSGSETVAALSGFDLEVAPGELVVLLGPSGCGKTTALRCIAGLEHANSGRITFGDRVVYDSSRRINVPPQQRNLGMVFQSYALWPHKTVRNNIAYPLQVRKMRAQLKDGWVEQAAEAVACSNLLDRFPAQLSGGQQQRIALARALVARPPYLLFDEPLSNLDALLRVKVRNEVHEIHQRLGFGGLYVTHDQDEAYAIGDRLVIMQAGRIEQAGTPETIYAHPSTDAAATFVGFSNVIDLEPGRRLRFRSEHAEVRRADDRGLGGLRFDAVVIDHVFAGNHREMTLEIDGTRILARVTEEPEEWCSVGSSVTLFVADRHCRFFGGDGRAVTSTMATVPASESGQTADQLAVLPK